MLKCAVFFFIALSVFADPWVLNKKILKEQLGSDAEIETLKKVLEEEGIEVELREKSDSILWKGERVSISLAKVPFAPYHLWVDLEGKRALDDCVGHDLIELHRGIARARIALKETIGADSFLIFLTDQPRRGKGSEWVGAEIVPILSGDVMDAREKCHLNEYMLYNRPYFQNVLQSERMIQKIKEALPLVNVVVQEEALQENWTQKLLHHEEALYQSIRIIYEELAATGALSSGEPPEMPISDESVLENRIDLLKCAFCNSKVIQKQIVTEWKDSLILMSHKPISPFGNFLILPKRHQCAFDLSPEEALSFWEAAAAVKRMLTERVGGDSILYVQDGRGAGQTVPHTHLHVFQIPDPTKHAIAGIQHIRNKRPILSEPQMRQTCEGYKPSLLERLARFSEGERRDQESSERDR